MMKNCNDDRIAKMTTNATASSKYYEYNTNNIDN